MGGAKVGRGDRRPFRIEPEVAKRTEDEVESAAEGESGDVLEEHDGGGRRRR
jgi:hypothetical protein